MKTTIFLLSLIISSSAFAKTVITLTKSSSICSVAFQTGGVKRIKGRRYSGFEIQDIKLSDLSMTKGSLESSVDSQWLSSGERYFISAYINSSIGPKHIPMVIPKKYNGGDKFLDINIDKYLPCSCFEGVEKPQKCGGGFGRFQDKSGNWWQQIDENTAKKIRY